MIFVSLSLTSTKSPYSLSVVLLSSHTGLNDKFVALNTKDYIPNFHCCQ